MIADIEKGTSCNLCDRGRIGATGFSLIYPYEYVYTFTREGSGIKVTICEDCIKEIINKTNVKQDG